jgi:hypothetical protein
VICAAASVGRVGGHVDGNVCSEDVIVRSIVTGLTVALAGGRRGRTFLGNVVDGGFVLIFHFG